MTHALNREPTRPVPGVVGPVADGLNLPPPRQPGGVHPTPIPRRRIGRAAVLAWIRQQVGAGAGVPDAHAIARHFGWRVTSAQDCLLGLTAEGLLRVAGREPPRSKHVYELTAAGCAGRSKVCTCCHTRKGEGSFWPSRHSRDGLAELCKVCCRAVHSTGRRRRRRGEAVAAGLAP